MKFENLLFVSQKLLLKKVRKETESLAGNVKRFESSVTNYHNDLQYIEYKESLNTIYLLR